MSIISELERNHDVDNDLALFNKVGDLYVRCNKIQEAVDMYDRAIRRYSELGLGNNAIALCHKILRNAPGRAETYLQLAELMMQRGFVTEAKQKFLEYADRMEQAGKLEDAFRALNDFANHASDTEEIRLLLAEQLKARARTEEARDQLEILYNELERTGRKSRATINRMKAIDPDLAIDEDLPQEAEPKPRKVQKTQDLIFLNLNEDKTPAPEPEEDAAVPGLEIEPTALTDLAAPAETEPAEAEPAPEPLQIERASLDPDDEAMVQARDSIPALDGLDSGREFEVPAEPVGTLDLEPTALDDAFEVEGGGGDVTIEVPDLELTVDALDSAPEAEAETKAPREPIADELKFDDAELDGAFQGLGSDEATDEVQDLSVDIAVEEAESDEVTVEDLESQILDDPDDPRLHRLLGEKLIERGDKDRGLEELGITLDGYEGKEDWTHAMTLVEEILRLDNNSIRHHQKRVELAYRAGDPDVLVDSYMSLADAFFRNGAMGRARSVYERILERDPENKQALAALIALEPEREAEVVEEPAAAEQPQTSGDFVDLGALILDDEVPVKDTRMRIQEEPPTGDEQRDFADMLAQFKKGIEENLGEEDAEAHYDLGVAFKEMGLLDEAIAEFQKALRGQHLRLKTSEALGMCFVEKRQFSVAATVLKRAAESDSAGDDDKIGVLYWLGRCQEEQGKGRDALIHYQRVFAVDIRFRDVRERVQQLSEATER